LVPGARAITQIPQRRQHPPQRLLFDAAVNTHPNPVGQIDLDHPDTLGQGQSRTRGHIAPAAIGTGGLSADAAATTPRRMNSAGRTVAARADSAALHADR
jgi:hypothetical protein